MSTTSAVSYPKHKIKIALLEKINAAAREKLEEDGYSVEEIPKSLKEQELMELMGSIHVLGIRSKTTVNEEHILKAVSSEAATRLLAIGCFGVGTNQVALQAATTAGIPVFNAPFASTRSVAELAVGTILMLARRLGDGNNAMHSGRWLKSAVGMREIRGKCLGLIGYGHIGQQVGLLAESVGFKVSFFDQTKKLPLGQAQPCSSLEDLLAEADFVSIHVPAAAKGATLIGKEQLAKMKPGSYLVNTSRGSLIDFGALREAVESKRLAGAAIDVYPKEPKTNDEEFDCGLCGLKNVVLTPHLGGSTEEAQRNIGIEVAASFIDYIDSGSSAGAVNFPQISLPPFPGSHRILNIHQNIPGALSDINKIVSDMGANISAQYLGTFKDVGYLIIDMNQEISNEVKTQISALPVSIRTRILY